MSHTFFQIKATLIKEVEDEQHLPPDLAVINFFQLVTSNRGSTLMQVLSMPGQPNPTLWQHYEAWFVTAKVRLSV